MCVSGGFVFEREVRQKGVRANALNPPGYAHAWEVLKRLLLNFLNVDNIKLINNLILKCASLT